MAEQLKRRPKSNFRKFFLRGLAILLPSVLTIWILIAAYGFVQSRIAGPINSGVRQMIVNVTPWPRPPVELRDLERPLNDEERAALIQRLDMRLHEADEWRSNSYSVQWVRTWTLQRWWDRHAWLLDLIGLVLAVVLIYTVGVVVGSFIGRRLYQRGEFLLGRVPLIRHVYPSVKQVTDFLVGDEEKQMRFSRVVAIEYPRKGLWSIGLVTGDSLRNIVNRAGVPCMTIFIPSSPTPFTGYVITAVVSDTIDLPMTIEEALRFVVSGGVIVPPSQRLDSAPLAGTVLPTPGAYDTVPAAPDR